MNFFICAVLLYIIAFLICCYIFNIKTTNKTIIISLVAVMISMIILGIRQIPPTSFDLYRYFLEMDYIRSLDFTEIMKITFSNVNFIWAIFESLVAIISRNNNIIFLFSIPLTVIPFIYILLNSKKEYNLTSRQIIILIFSYFAIVNVTHIMSGIRNALAISTFSLGMYLELFKNKRKGYIFYILSMLIHPMVIIFLAFRVLSKFIYKIKFEVRIGHLLVLCWSLFSKAILYVLKFCLSVLPLGMLKLYVEKLNTEIYLNMGIDYRIVALELIQIIVFIILIYRVIKNKKDFDNKLFIFYYIGFFIVGSLTMPTIFTRTRFIFAYFLPILLGYTNIMQLSDKQKNTTKILEHSMLILAIIINIYYIYYMYCNSVFV